MKLVTTDQLKGFRIQASDGRLGALDDFIFDDVEWVVRYMVVDTHPWWPGGRVLVAKQALHTPDWENGLIPVALEKKQARGAPSVNVNEPLSRGAEAALHKYFSWLPYWGPSGQQLGIAPGASPAGGDAEHEQTVEREMRERRRADGIHVHRLGKMVGYEVLSGDAQEHLGYLSGHVLEMPDWQVRYLVMDTRRRLPGRKVLLVPSWIETLSWDDRSIRVSIGGSTIRQSPEFDPDRPISSEYARSLVEYYRQSQGGQTRS